MIDQVMSLWWRLIRFGFRLLYYEMAFTYDWVSKIVSMGQWRCWQRTVIKHLESSYDVPVLELAHGTGDLQIDLHRGGYDSVGYDLSPYMGNIASRKLRRNQIIPKFARGYGQALPFADAVFPAVVCTFPTPFIIEPATLRELWRVLQPGGKLVVVLSGFLTGKSLTESAIEWLYSVTGQRDGDVDAFLQPFTAVGFRAEVVQEACKGSVAILVVAEKMV